MNKSELIDELSARFDGNRRAAQHALEAVLETVTRSVAKGEAVAITGFGKFEKRVRPAGTARNPQTGATVRTKKRSVPKFTPGAEFKAIVNGERKLAAAAKSTVQKATSTARSAATKAAPAKKAPAKKAPAKTTARKAAPAKKAPAKKAPAKTTARKAAPAKKAPAKRAPAKTTARKAAPAKKAPAKRAPAKKAPAKRTAAKKA